MPATKGVRATLAGTRAIVIATLSWVALSASAPGQPPRRTCLDTGRVATRVPVGPGTLALTLTGGRRVILSTRGECAHLDEIGARYLLEFEHSEGRKLCVGDRFRVVDPLLLNAAGAIGTPFCRVAAITPA